MAGTMMRARVDPHSEGGIPLRQQSDVPSGERRSDAHPSGASAPASTTEGSKVPVVGQLPPKEGGVELKTPSQHVKMAPTSAVPNPVEPKSQTEVATAAPDQEGRAIPIHINIVSLAARVTELAGCQADEAINKKFDDYKESSASMKPGFWHAVGRLVTTPVRLNTYKAAWLRMTADAKRARLCERNRGQIYGELAQDEQKQNVLRHFSQLETRDASSIGFGERRINNKDGSSPIERRIRAIALEYLAGDIDETQFEAKKGSILEIYKVRDCVDNALPQLAILRSECERAADRVQKARELMSRVSFGVWEDSCAAGEKLRKGIGDRLVSACHGSTVLGSVPGVALATATAVSVAVYLAKGGFGTRQLAVGAATSVGTSLALGAAIASAPVLSGLVIGTGVAAAFACLRKGKELKKDLHQVRTEKVLGKRNATTESLSPKDALFQKKYINLKALNVGEQTKKLRESLDANPADVAKLIGETEAALLLQNDPRERANTLEYSDPTAVARERLELIQALVETCQKLENIAREAVPNTNLWQQLEKEIQWGRRDFMTRFLGEQEKVDGAFARYRRRQQLTAGATTVVIGGAMGGLFYGAAKSIEALRESWSPAATTRAPAPLAPATNVTNVANVPHSDPPVAPVAEPSPPVSASPAPSQDIVQVQDKPLPFDPHNLPKGITVQEDGSIIANLSETEEKVLVALRSYQPQSSSVELEAAVAEEKISYSITQSLGLAGSEHGVNVGTLGKEFHFDNGTTRVDGNESGLHWGGVGQRGVSKDGSVVYDIKSMFKRESFYLQGGKKVSLDVGEIVKHGDVRTPEQGRIEMILRLDAKNPNEIIRIPVQPDGSIVIPDEVKQAAYRVTPSGQTEYLGWKASVGLVREVDGKITFGEIATDFGGKQLNGSKVIETIPGKEAVNGLVFPKATAEVPQNTRSALPNVEPAPIAKPPVFQAPVVKPVPAVEPVTTVPPVATVEEAKPLELHNLFFPISWADRRESLSPRGMNEESPTEPQKKPLDSTSVQGDQPQSPEQATLGAAQEGQCPTPSGSKGDKPRQEVPLPIQPPEQQPQGMPAQTMTGAQSTAVPSSETSLPETPVVVTPEVVSSGVVTPEVLAVPPKKKRTRRTPRIAPPPKEPRPKAPKADSNGSPSGDTTPLKPPRKKRSDELYVTVERTSRGGAKQRHAGWISPADSQ
jgi:hypothetical protein